MLILLGLTREPAKMFHLSLAARNGLPAPSANEIESEGSASVPDPQEHPHGHLQGEGRPGGAGAVPPWPGLGGGHGRWQLALVALTELGLFYPSLLHVCARAQPRTWQQEGKHRKWNTFTGTVINVFHCFILFLIVMYQNKPPSATVWRGRKNAFCTLHLKAGDN